MRANNSVELAYPDAGSPDATANVYDFGARQTESGRQLRIRALEHENALLARIMSEIGLDVSRLRRFLTGP